MTLSWKSTAATLAQATHHKDVSAIELTPAPAVPPFALHIQGVEKIDDRDLAAASVLRADAAFEAARPWADS